MYYKNCPKEYETFPEIIFDYDQGEKAKSIGANKCKLNEAIVGSLDLRHGEKLIQVIEKAISLSKGKLKGIRMLLAAHSDSKISSGAVKTPPGIMKDIKFISDD